jgi:hypothetical protein
MLIKNPLLLPSLKAAGNIVIGKSTLPCFILDWAGFPAEAGPDGCVDARFALSKDIASKLRELSLATELSSPDDLGRWAADCCMIATAGCVSALSKLLADSAVVIGADGSTAWIPKERKESLSNWISTRIWRLSSLTKRTGHDPESLSLIGLPDKEERVPMITAPAVSNVAVLSETLEKKEDSPPYDYRAVAARLGKMYRVHLGTGNIHVRRTNKNGSEEVGAVRMDRTKGGKIVVLTTRKYKASAPLSFLGADRQSVADDMFVAEYNQTSVFLEDWVLNGEEQSPGMIEEIGDVPGLKGEARSFRYSPGFLRSNPNPEDKAKDDGLYRSVAISPVPKGLENLGSGDMGGGGLAVVDSAIIEEGDVFVDRVDGQWFSIGSIHAQRRGRFAPDGDETPSFHLFSTTPTAQIRPCNGVESGAWPRDGADAYPEQYENESTDTDVTLDDLLSGYVCMEAVDSASRDCELVVTRTVKGKDCISVLLAKGPKIMMFKVGDCVPGQSKIVALKDDRVVFHAEDGVAYAEMYEDLAKRVGYWDKIKAPGVRVPPEDQEGSETLPTTNLPTSYERGAPVGVKVGELAKEFGVSTKIIVEIAKANNIEVRNASTILKPGQADRLRARLAGRAYKGK